MTSNNQARFHLVDDEGLREINEEADSKSTKLTDKISPVKIFEDYLKRLLTWTLQAVDELPNSDLDEIIGKFYCGARQKNGELYCKKTDAVQVRFGLQRHFINKGQI